MNARFQPLQNAAGELPIDAVVSARWVANIVDAIDDQAAGIEVVLEMTSDHAEAESAGEPKYLRGDKLDALQRLARRSAASMRGMCDEVRRQIASAEHIGRADTKAAVQAPEAGQDPPL